MYEKNYVGKPFPHQLHGSPKALMEILSVLEATNVHFSFVGGFVRDYGKRPYNDLDIATTNQHNLREKLTEMHVLKPVNEEEMDQTTDSIPHDTFYNPYVFDDPGFPIHFIHSDNGPAYAPSHFDFSINEFALKSDMHVYAPTHAWRDLYQKLIRLNKEQYPTTNNIMRAVRFACRTGFQFEVETEKRIREFLANATSGRWTPPPDAHPFEPLGGNEVQHRLASNRVLSGLDKIVEDGVAEPALIMFRDLGFEGAKDVAHISELRRHHNDLIVSGKAHIEYTREY